MLYCEISNLICILIPVVCVSWSFHEEPIILIKPNEMHLYKVFHRQVPVKCQPKIFRQFMYFDLSALTASCSVFFVV